MSTGLIPACAGKTQRWVRVDHAARAHPRMRGENDVARAIGEHPEGSSPHARGKPASYGDFLFRFGLIPACAGKTTHVGCPVCGAWAHPRMRGENKAPKTGSRSSRGSSPHARGKRRVSAAQSFRMRLIPACAGKTGGSCDQWRRRGAHPRMRGENSATSASRSGFGGSSPHARGKRRAWN